MQIFSFDENNFASLKIGYAKERDVLYLSKALTLTLTLKK